MFRFFQNRAVGLEIADANIEAIELVKKGENIEIKYS